MSGVDGAALLAAAVSAVAAASLARLVARPTRRLAARVRPYSMAARAHLGGAPDALEAELLGTAQPSAVLSGGTLWRLFGPPIERLARALGSLVDTAGDQALSLRLRQAGLFEQVPERNRVQEYRVRQLGSAVLHTALFGAAAFATGQAAAVVLAVMTAGFFFGATRWRGRVDRAIEQRRLRMRIELYTVNQLLAMHVRVGGGVVQALQRVVDRGSGAVVTELAEVLRAHRSGRRLFDALSSAARTTPEPHAARTYKLLANGAEFGADLADGLRALSEDIRGERAEALKRTATKRRAAMLVPIIAVLAPIMLLFVAAPLPSIVFGGW